MLCSSKLRGYHTLQGDNSLKSVDRFDHMRYSIPTNHSTLMINFVLSKKHDSRVKTKSPPSSWKNITLLAILLVEDIQLNPGPSVYPCGYCEIPVT